MAPLVVQVVIAGMSNMNEIVDTRLPEGWNSVAHDHWCKGNSRDAIQTALSVINSHEKKKPVLLVLQLSYYLF